MAPIPDLRATVLDAWQTNSLVTSRFVEQLPDTLLDAPVPGVPRRTVRIIAAHLHNSRGRWIRTLGQEHGIVAPALVDLRKATRRSLLAALKRSGRGIGELLQLGIDAGGVIPPSKGYVWRNLPLDVGHVLSYFVAHEGHHRGQIIMIARQLGQRLPPEVVDGVWQFTTRVREWKRGA
jgi:uncharacterized damage-inducible protein DinB